MDKTKLVKELSEYKRKLSDIRLKGVATSQKEVRNLKKKIRETCVSLNNLQTDSKK